MKESWKAAGRSFIRSWRLPAAFAAVLALAFLWWLAPRRTTQLVSADGRHQWLADSAPVERRVVWSPAEPLAGVVDAKAPQAIDSGPEWSGGGTIIYFSRRAPDGDSDIYRTLLVDDRWLPAEPVDGVNSSSNELAPSISLDGRELYFASDRPGGHGGLDLYVCQRTDESLDTPGNLGPAVNGPADEQDPAVSPDQAVLYFASNRPASPPPIAEGGTDGTEGRPQFDLFAARRGTAEGAWTDVEPLAALNRPHSDETAPFSAASGHFYFASNRAERQGEHANFDLYRVRLSGEASPAADAAVENLGPGINTPANETQPALSPEGFSLLWTSDRHSERESGRTSLFRSTAQEVLLTAAWDTSRVQALAGVWWQAAGLTLLVAALVAVMLLARGRIPQRASAARFFAASLILHLAILVALLYIPLANVIVEKMEQIRVQAAQQSADDNLHQSHRPGEAAYEKVADLRSLDQVRTSEVQRQVVTAPNVPLRTDTAVPTLPAELARSLPPSHLLVVPPPRQALPAVEPAELTRDAVEPAEVMEEPIPAPRPAAAVPLPAERPVDARVELARGQEPAMSTAMPEDLPRRAPPVSSAAATSIDAPAVDPVAQIAAATPLARAGPRPQSMSEPEPAEQAAPVAVDQPAAEAPPAAGDVLGPRIAPAETASPRRIESAAPRLGVAQEIAEMRLAEPALVSVDSPADAAEIEREATAVLADAPDPAEPVPLPQPVALAAMTEVELDPLATTVPRQSVAPVAPPRASTGDSLPALERAPIDALADMSPLEALSGPGTEPAASARMEVARVAADRRDSMTETAEAPVAAAAEALPGETPLPGIGTQLARTDAEPLVLDAMTPDEIGGPRGPLRHEVVLGILADRAVDAPPTLAPHATELTRPPAEALSVAYAEDNVGMRAMFTLRQGDVRQEFIELFGGSAETEAAVRRGLDWLARHQNDDGHWSLNQFAACCRDHPQCTGHGGTSSDTAATGFALLPFLGTGHTHQQGDFQPRVAAALTWLRQRQRPNGDLFAEPPSNAWMYSHGVAAIAVCEAYGLTQDSELRDVAQRSLDFTVAAQHQSTGGWRYTPGEPGDTSVVGWQVMALKSGEMAGLSVPPSSLALAGRWLSSAEGTGGGMGQFGYQGPGGSPAMTAEGLLCRQFLGLRRDDLSMRAGARFLLERLPVPGQETSYYWYYATQVMYHMQGDYWDQWNLAMRDALLATQIKDGPLAGTWDPVDQWEQSGGRIYSTSLRLLMLEVYYRHLPLYRQLEE